MQAYRNDKLDFVINIPGEWELPKFGASNSRMGKLISFKCKYYEQFEVHIQPFDSQPSCKEIEDDFKNLNWRYSYTSFSLGRIVISGLEHVWARYYLGGGRWKKIYKIIIAENQYEFTAICMNQNMLLEREVVWDNVVASFRNSQTQDHYTPPPPKQQAPTIKVEQEPVNMDYPTTSSGKFDPAGINAAFQILQASINLNKIEGNPVSNLNKAIQHFHQALKFYTRQDFPMDWASAQNGLGEAFRRLSLFSYRQKNLDQAIFHYRQALECLDPIPEPDLWAAVHNNLGIAYANGASGSQTENLESAIKHCKQALEIYTLDTYPDDWAMTQNNLGLAYNKRIYGDLAENLEKAIFHFNQALKVQVTQTNRSQWAGTHYNLVLAYWNRINKIGLNESEKVIHHCQQALTFYTRQTHPNDWAFLNNRLESAYQLQKQSDKAEKLQNSAKQSELASQFLNRLSHPKERETVKNNIEQTANTHQDGNHADNIEKDISILTYPQFYFKESELHSGKQHILKLKYSAVPDFPYTTNLMLVYEWDVVLTEEEKTNLANRAIVYISCAIYDVAIQAGLICQPSPIPNGRRPAWILEGEKSPISLTTSEIHKDDNTCHMTIGPMLVAVGKPPGDRNRWEKLHTGFKSLFTEIKV